MIAYLFCGTLYHMTNHKPLCLSLRHQLSGNLPFSPDQTHAQGLIMWVSLKNMLAICLIYSKQRERESGFLDMLCMIAIVKLSYHSRGLVLVPSGKFHVSEYFFPFLQQREKVSDIFHLLQAWVISKIKLAKWNFTIKEEKRMYQCIIKPWKLSCHLERLRAYAVTAKCRKLFLQGQSF